MRKLRKIISFALVIAMMVSLFTNCQLPVFATGETESTETTTTETGNTDITLDFVSENNETAEIISAVGQNATIKGTSVNIYKDVYYGAPGMNITVAEGTVIDLVQALEFPSGTVLYYYEYSDNENAANAELYEYSFDYKYISAADITVLSGDAESEATPSPSEEPTATPEATTTPEATVTPEATASPEATATPEVTASPEATTTPEATATPSAEPTTSPEVEDEMSGITDYGSLDFDAYIIPESLTIYKSHMDDVEYVTVADVKGETIHVYYYYELSDNTVKYKVEYTGENTALAAAISGGYTFVKSADVAKIAADSTTGVSVSGNLPQDVTVTVTPADVAELPLENSDITIGENSLFYDVTLMQNGETYTADGDVTVTFPADKVPFASGSTYYAYHIKDDGTVETYGPFEYTGGDIAVEFSSLSYVGIAAASTETTSEIEDIEDFQAIFTTTPVRLYKNQYTDDTYAEDYTEVAVTDADIITVDYQYTFTDSEGNQTVVYSINYTGDNASLREAVAPVDETATTFRFVKAEHITEYILPAGPTEEEIEEAYNKFMQSGILEDFENSYEVAVEYGAVDYFTDEQKAEIDSIKTTLEEMAKATYDWTTIDVEANISGDGIKIYRNPVTRPNDYVLANEVEPMTEGDAGSEKEEIEVSEASITGKYTDVNGNTYFILDTDNWEVFEGRVPYRYVSQEDIVVSEKWVKINKDGAFTKDEVSLYSELSEDVIYAEITDGLSRGMFDIMYQVIKTDYTGSQEVWYLIDINGWISADIYSAYVKEDDVKLITSIVDPTGVSVYGDIPDGATLSVSSVSLEDTGLDNGIYPVSENSLFYDVTLLDTANNETQPGDGGITVTFPEDQVVAAGLTEGDSYATYHIHDGNVDISSANTYNGGNISMTVANLSTIGISESAEGDNVDLATAHEGIKNKEYLDDVDEIPATFADDETILYGSFDDGTYFATVTNASGTPINLNMIITYNDGYIIYGYEYTGDDTTSDLYDIMYSYSYIGQEDINTNSETDYNQLYSDLLSTKTIEEWEEISVNYSDEEWLVFFDSLTEEEIETLDNHLYNLPSAFDKAVQDAYNNLLETTTVEQFETLYKSLSKEQIKTLTFAQKITLFHYHLELLIAESIDKFEDHEFPGGPKEAFTNVATFAADKIDAVETEQMETYSLMSNVPIVVSEEYPIDLAALPTGTEYTTDTSGALVMKKTAVAKNDGSGEYTVTLEAYTTGTVTTTQDVNPVDITLVLDVSGSMQYCMVCGEKVTNNNNTHDVEGSETYVEYTGNYSKSKEYYYKNGDEYIRVYRCRGSEGPYGHSAGWYTVQHSQGDHGGTRITSQIYEKTASQENCTVRMDALEDAVQQFIESTKDQNAQITADEDKHRIAIVKFASDYVTTVGNTKNDDEYNNSQIVQNLTIVTDDNYDDMQATVEGFDPAGATRIDYGMRHAKSIVDGQANSGRTQVVIVFTDGTPTASSGFNVPVANSALDYAKSIKDSNATVYTISVANGADVNAGGTIPSFPTKDVDGNNISASFNETFESDNVSGPDDSTEITDPDMFGLMNRFMHLLSSNNPAASNIYAGQERTTVTEGDITYTATGQKEVVDGNDVWSSYYLVPRSADDLTAIFGQISDDVSGEADIQLGVSTTVKDIVTPYFTIPDGASGVSVSTVECLTYDEETGEATWSDTFVSLDSTYTDENGDIQNVVTVEGNGVDVSGFDFTSNFVSENGRSESDPNTEGTFHGRKLVITVDVKPSEYFLGGNGVDTNGETTGVFDGAGTEVGEFYYPDVDVALVDLDIDWDDQFIYITNAADIDTLFKNATVTSRYDNTKTETLANVLDGDNNAYVDIVFTVKEKNGDVVGTYTVNAGNSLDEDDVVEWELSDGKTLTPVLDDDTVYKLTWTITPTDATGTATAVNHNTPVEATVYVFRPELTFKDSVAYVGSNYPTINNTNNLTSTKWKHSTLGTTDEEGNIIKDSEDTGLQMSDTEPELTISYDAPTGVVQSKTDVKVHVTSVVRTDKASVSVPYTKAHTDCVENEDIGDEALIIHVYAPAITLNDSFVYYGNNVPTDEEYKANIVGDTVTWFNSVLGTDTTTNAPTLTFDFTTNITGEKLITDQDDITVDVVVSVGDNIINNSNIDFTHTDCSELEGTCAVDSGQFLLHIVKPIVTFADRGVYYGSTIPAASNTTAYDNVTTKWKYKDTVMPTSVEGTKPTITFTYDNTLVQNGGTVSTTGDINVLVTAYINNEILPSNQPSIIGSSTCPINDTSCTTAGGFKLHVYTPEFNTKDTTGYLGDNVPETDSLVTGETWKYNDNTPDPDDMVGTKPTLTVSTKPGTGVEDGIIVTTKDIPVDAVVKIGDEDITEVVKFNHAKCEDDETLPVDAVLLIHVETVSLDVTKIVKDPNGDVIEGDTAFTFTIEFAGNVFDKVLTILKDSEEATLQVTDGKATMEMTLTHGQTITFTGLPVGSYTITEADPGAAYVTTVDNVTGRETTVSLSKDNPSGKVEFINTLTVADLTITKNVPVASYNEEDTFVFDVDLDKDGKSDLTVVINSNTMTLENDVWTASVKVKNINVGTEVTVTEDTTWSWRYKVDDADKTTTITADGVSVDFTNTVEKTQWLSSEAYAENSFSAVGASNPTIAVEGIKFVAPSSEIN